MLLVLGGGSFILPLMNMQFHLMQPLEKAQPVAGIVVSALGLLLIVLGLIRSNAKRERAVAQMPASQWTPPQMPPYAPNMSPQMQQGAALPGAMQTGNCMRCGHPLWAGDVVCRTCRLPVNFGRPPQQPVYAATPSQTPPPPSPPAPTQVVLRCPNPACGQIARPGKKFCASCGTRLA
jgi:hypothetical protein